MDSTQIKLVQESFAKVAPISEQAAALFYDRLFEVAPSVKAMFPDDMTEQRRKLMATLAVVVNGLSNLEAVLPAASALAAGSMASRLLSPFTTTASVAINFLRCSAMSFGNIALTVGAASNRRS